MSECVSEWERVSESVIESVSLSLSELVRQAGRQ